MGSKAEDGASTSSMGEERPLAQPLHLQRLERAVKLDSFIGFIHNYFSTPINDEEETEADSLSDIDQDGDVLNGVSQSERERRAEKMKLYNLSGVKKSRRWLKNVLLSDTSDSGDNSPTEDDLQDWLRFHKLRQIAKAELNADPDLRQHQYYGVGMLSQHDPYPEHQRVVVGGRKKSKEKKVAERKKAKLKRVKLEREFEQELTNQDISDLEAGSPEDARGTPESPASEAQSGPKTHGRKKSAAAHEVAMATKRRRLWVALSKKEITRAQKQKVNAHKEMLTSAKRFASACQREVRRNALASQKACKDTAGRARRLTREMMLYWKRYEKVEKEHRKRAEKEAQEQLRIDIELREAKRQQRKLNFLITQTELYAHFMSRKMSGLVDTRQDEILHNLDDPALSSHASSLLDTDDDDYDNEAMKAQALQNAEEAYRAHQAKTEAFDNDLNSMKKTDDQKYSTDFKITDPCLATEDLLQPRMFVGNLKTYQLKGMNWLYSLYDKGINGILADEMGLGKTVQTIAFLAALAEVQSIWGPFLVIAPASTLHNWQQEFTKFVPKFRVVPYWGNTSDRKVLRQFWSDLHTEKASFHVLITSYQLVVQDVKYFQRIHWQYMVLDEAQAIKSTSSVRWKILLAFNCRNRLLLTGTPIQNTMAELWALLHFIMPTLFDSHEEFNEWFSKDIESHAENRSTIDEKHLSRLHMILKPFMLRRVKKDVENELSDKIEVQVYCPLARRQKNLYQGLRNKISIEDLMQSSAAASASQAQSATSSLMNLVMQFRKVCNHPDLFERREVRSPFHMRGTGAYNVPKLLFTEGVFSSWNQSRSRWPTIFHPSHVHHSMFKSDTQSVNTFSFSRFVGLSSAELAKIMLCGLLERFLCISKELQEAQRLHHRHVWKEHQSRSRYLGPTDLMMCRHSPMAAASLSQRGTLQRLVFTSGAVYTVTKHRYHAMRETPAHFEMRQRKLLAADPQPGSKSPEQLKESPGSPPKKLLLAPLPEFPHRLLPTQVLSHVPTEVPRFVLGCCSPKVTMEAREVTCNMGRAQRWWHSIQECGSPEALSWWRIGCTDPTLVLKSKQAFRPLPLGGLASVRPSTGWSHICIPDKESLVTDSGKLQVLDTLLKRLKSEGHRVLIYSQMTRMIDLLEEYMWHRKHTYMRLDGSSKISDRRDMVADFQTRTDIFVFLLSTRAGGLGINLTAADTVIFYDSDWNPTVDQQAMDRAHRLGQTKQVTVYRLICKGSIEERILQRAREKSEIQRMVISGGNFKPDTLKPKEVVSLLLDDAELERKFRQRQEERRQLEDWQEKPKERKRRSDKGEKRGPRKKKKEENNVTIASGGHMVPSAPAPSPGLHQPDVESVISLDSVPPSPYSERSLSSLAVAQDDTSSEGPLIVDDSSPSSTPLPTLASSESPGVPSPGNKSRRGSGRGRGRPRGSTRRGGVRGRGSMLAAAERAGAQAGAQAGFAAYGYSVPWGSTSSITTSVSGGTTRPATAATAVSAAAAAATSSSPVAAATGFLPRATAPSSFRGTVHHPGPRHPGAGGCPPRPASQATGHQPTGLGFYVQGSNL